jgi:hypothetical protein
MQAGLRICQVKVIDDTGGSLSFPRQACAGTDDSSSAPAASPSM